MMYGRTLIRLKFNTHSVVLQYMYTTYIILSYFNEKKTLKDTARYL
jgi:hypothetical protein